MIYQCLQKTALPCPGSAGTSAEEKRDNSRRAACIGTIQDASKYTEKDFTGRMPLLLLFQCLTGDTVTQWCLFKRLTQCQWCLFKRRRCVISLNSNSPPALPSPPKLEFEFKVKLKLDFRPEQSRARFFRDPNFRTANDFLDTVSAWFI